MADDDRNTPHRPSLPAWPTARGELLWEFVRLADRKHFRCELIEGGGYGLEVRILDGETVISAHMFTRDMDPTRTPRQLAVEWANEERHLLQILGAALPVRPAR
jgi:hypothetical protein